MPQTDTLETVLKLAGAAQYIRYLNQAAQGHQKLAQAQEGQARAQAQVQAAQSRFVAQQAIAAGRVQQSQQRLAAAMLSGQVRQIQAAQAQLALRQQAAQALAGRGSGSSPAQLALAGGAGVAAAQEAASSTVGTAVMLAALTATAAAIKVSIDAYADYDRAVIRTEGFLRNMGTNLPTREFVEFSRQMSQATGTSETDIVNLQGYLARFGTSASQIKRATGVIIGASKQTGVSVEEMARLIEAARRGRGMGLWRELGIPIKAVQGQLLDLNQILDIVERKTAGGAQLFANSLPGAMDRAGASLEMLKKDFGELISPLVIVWLNQVANTLNWIANGLHGLNQALGITPGKLGTAAANGIGAGGGTDKSEDYLREISFNTGPQGPLGKAVRGGGSFGELGGGLRIRDFNGMFRHV